MPNKVRYGLKNVHYATVTFASDGTPTFGTPVAIPGAVSVNLSKQGDTYTFYADDGSYFELGDNASGYVAKLTDTELGFYDGDTKVAYISNNKLYITNAEITDNLQIGKYQWITDSTGRMSLKWVG